MTAQITTIEMQNANWIAVEDYKFPGGWTNARDTGDKDARSRALCRELEAGRILFFPKLPYDFPSDEREFLLSRQWNELRLHKNVSYRPSDDVLRGFSGDHGAVTHLHHIVRSYSAHVVDFLRDFLRPYAGNWKLDFASFRPLEEEGRDLSLHKRNDLLHVDAFRLRPTRGGRILRVFTNLHPTKPRVAWYAIRRFRLAGRQICGRRGARAVRGEERIFAAKRVALGGYDGAGAAEPHAVRPIYAAIPRLPERERRLSAQLPQSAAGISAAGDVDGVYRRRGPCRALRAIRDRADPDATDPARSAGGTGIGALPDTRTRCRSSPHIVNCCGAFFFALRFGARCSRPESRKWTLLARALEPNLA